MTETEAKWGRIGPRWRWLIWLTYVTAWTTSLLVPVPSGTWTVEELGLDLKFLIGKTLHVSAYAVLAMLSGWLRVPARYRWLVLFAVMVHGPLTEFLQLFTANRTGSLQDVCLDHLGVALGLLLTWKWWSEPS